MSEKKRKPALQKKDEPPKKAFNLGTAVSSMFKDRHPILKFLLGFIGCMAVFYGIYFSSFYQSFIEKPLLYFQANIGNGILHLLDHDTKVAGAAIGSNNFSVDIQNGCDGMEAIAILVSGILIFPASARQKGKGLLWGISTLVVLNLLRIAALYLIGINFSKQVFELFHIQGGFILFTMISVLLLFTWMNWVMKNPAKQSA